MRGAFCLSPFVIRSGERYCDLLLFCIKYLIVSAEQKKIQELKIKLLYDIFL